MAHLDTVASLVDELDDMETELRLHNLGNLLGVGEVECHIGEGWVEHTATYIVELTATTG